MPFLDTKTNSTKEPRADWTDRFFNSQSMTFRYCDTVAGFSFHERSHRNKEILHVIAFEKPRMHELEAAFSSR